MSEEFNVQRRPQFCGLCGQLMFQFYRSPDGHFGLVETVVHIATTADRPEICCSTCGARYRVLERLNSMGQPIERR